MALFISTSPRLLSYSPLVQTLPRPAPPPASIIRGFSAADPSEPSATLDDPSSSSKSSSSGQGFGSSSSISSANPNLGTSNSKKKQKGKGGKERDSIIRRSPIEKPRLVSRQDEAQAQEVLKNESAFLLGWLGLGGIILVEGLALAASGFLPEAWDKLLVKYLYPSFTPIVFLFVAGTVSYGVFKYLQNNDSLKK